MQTNTQSRNTYFDATNISTYLKEYSDKLSSALSKISLEEAVKILGSCKGRIFVGGNGGSAAIADHLACDFEKGASIQTHSLVGRTALFTAIANDIGYDATFLFQLESAKLTKDDIVLLISSSGNSPNVVKAAEHAVVEGAWVIGLTGFSGGKLKLLSDISLHVPVNNYGVVEDCHQAIMHVLAQFIHLGAHK